MKKISSWKTAMFVTVANLFSIGCCPNTETTNNQQVIPRLLQHGDRIDAASYRYVESVAFIRDVSPELSGGAGDNRNDDADMAQLAKLTNLKNLSVADSQVTKVGFASLNELVRLEAVDASGTNIDDSALNYLSASKGLVVLQLNRTHITSAGAQYIAEHFPSLESLALSHTGIDDQAIASLTQLSRLRYLDLSCTKVTDKSIAHLSRMKQLKTLDVSRLSEDDSTISKQGAEALRRALPQTDVVHW